MAAYGRPTGEVCQLDNYANPPRSIGEMLYLFRNEHPTQDFALPVGQPLLEDLVAAELVVPDGRGVGGLSPEPGRQQAPLLPVQRTPRCISGDLGLCGRLPLAH